MKNNAISIANYFIDKANEDTSAPYQMTLLRLVKYVYIAYGIGMALLDRIIIDERFDKVEAWKYGPVIPSVYHSFKHYQNNKITQKASIVSYEGKDGFLEFETPMVDEDIIKELLDFVWNVFRMTSTPQLIDNLHARNTPWAHCYRVGENMEIPHEITKTFYKTILDNAKR